MTQTFIDCDAKGWTLIDFLPGVTLLPLAQPVKEGSIHRARLSRGAIVPVHTHPADEYVMVLNGTVGTGGRAAKREHSGSHLQILGKVRIPRQIGLEPATYSGNGPVLSRR